MVEENETPHPANIGLFGTQTIVAQANLGPQTVEQLGRILRNHLSIHPQIFRQPIPAATLSKQRHLIVLKLFLIRAIDKDTRFRQHANYFYKPSKLR